MSKIRPNNFDAGAAAAARAAAGLTQQQVADAVGKTKALVQHWEAGRRQPYPEITRALADLYGVDVEDLLVSPLELAMADMAMVRRAQRISVDEMAERIGVSTRSIEQVEAGARMPDDPIAWAAGYKVSLPALATAWRNTPAPIAESLEPVGGRRIEPGPISPVTTALATAYDAEPERLQVSARRTTPNPSGCRSRPRTSTTTIWGWCAGAPASAASRWRCGSWPRATRPRSCASCTGSRQRHICRPIRSGGQGRTG